MTYPHWTLGDLTISVMRYDDGSWTLDGADLDIVRGMPDQCQESSAPLDIVELRALDAVLRSAYARIMGRFSVAVSDRAAVRRA